MRSEALADKLKHVLRRTPLQPNCRFYVQGLLPGTSLNGANIPLPQLLLPYPITRNELSNGRGWYNALQLQISKRLSHGLISRLSILGRYQFPFFSHSKGFARAILGGWQLDAIALFQSGRQLNGLDAYPAGVDPFISGPKGRTDTTSMPEPREVRPPSLDSSVFKTFYPKEGFQVQFRMETDDQRNIQLALKLAF